MNNTAESLSSPWHISSVAPSHSLRLVWKRTDGHGAKTSGVTNCEHVYPCAIVTWVQIRRRTTVTSRNDSHPAQGQEEVKLNLSPNWFVQYERKTGALQLPAYPTVRSAVCGVLSRLAILNVTFSVWFLSGSDLIIILERDAQSVALQCVVFPAKRSTTSSPSSPGPAGLICTFILPHS